MKKEAVRTLTIIDLVSLWGISDKQVRRRLKAYGARAYRFNARGQKEYAEKEVARVHAKHSEAEAKKLAAA